MIPYFFIFFTCFIFAILDLSVKNNAFKNGLLLVWGCIIIVFSGFRWETGTDWENYLAAFNNIPNLRLGESGYELFYEILIRISSQFSNEYTLVLFLTAIVIYSCTYFTLKKFSPYPIFSLLLLLSYSINSIGFGYRQDLAIALTFFSFLFIVKRQFFFFLTFIVVATLFHQSAIIFLPAYWIAKFAWNKKSVMILSLFGVLLYTLTLRIQHFALFYSDSAAIKILSYTEMTPEEKVMGDGDPLMILLRGFLNRFFLIIPPLLVILINRSKSKYVIEIFNIMLFSLVLFILLSPLGYVFLRFTRYYEIFHIILVPLVISLASPKTRVFLIAFYLVYCIFKFSFVLLTDKGIYVPYNTIF
jgi:hypothetical protein